MSTLARHAFAALAAFSLAACQTAGGSGIRMEPESALLAQGMHPTIRSAFEADFIHVIVKGTSAEAMARACPANVRVVPTYRSSLNAVLRSNDIEFAPGTSRKEVAQKVVEHRRANNCAALASRLNAGGYDNLFLERI
jgi:hypothetical protein